MTKLRKVVLCVPGGTAGQIFALCYGLVLAETGLCKPHIRFYDIGTTISKLSIEPLLSSKTATSLGITYNSVKGNLTWNGRGMNALLNLSLARIRGTSLWRRIGKFVVKRKGLQAESVNSKVDPGQLSSGVIRLEELNGLELKRLVIGYPTDLRVIEKAWACLKKVLSESDVPNFSQSPGTQESIAIHWRLGDFLEAGAAVAWPSIEKCLTSLPDSLPINIHTDSPHLAKSLVQESRFLNRLHFVSNDIWDDLFSMTRSRYFIGSPSGISFLASLSVLESELGGEVFVPDYWMTDPDLGQEYASEVSTFRNAKVYQSSKMELA